MTKVNTLLEVMDSYIELVDQSTISFGSSLQKLATLRLAIPYMGASFVDAFVDSVKKDASFVGAVSGFGDTALRANLASYIRCAGSFILGATTRALSDVRTRDVRFVSEDMAARLVEIADTYGKNPTISILPGALSEDEVLENLAIAIKAESFMLASTQLDARMYDNTANGVVHFVEYVNTSLDRFSRPAMVSVLKILVSIGYIITQSDKNTIAKTWVPSLMKLRITDGTLASIPAPTQRQLAFYAEPEAPVLSGKALRYLTALAALYQQRLK